ncbi:hypothetical protein Vafri_15405, partial [Volvox africanus]
GEQMLLHVDYYKQLNFPKRTSRKLFRTVPAGWAVEKSSNNAKRVRTKPRLCHSVHFARMGLSRFCHEPRQGQSFACSPTQRQDSTLSCPCPVNQLTRCHAPAVAKSSGSGRSSGSSAGSTTSSSGSSRTTTYGSSVGVTARYRILGAAVLTYVYFHGQSYPATRFNYTDYYDDCALRNITAYQTGLNDSSIDPSVVASLPDLLATSTTSGDLIAFNHTLHNATNGLIIDSEYCNYTTLSTSESAGGAVSVALVPLLLMLLLAAIVNW